DGNFLFSGRRRHTRFSRDWSSDVCSSDLLPIPSSTGYSTRLSNVGSIRNRGWEFSVNSENLTGELKWSTQVNLATLANEVLDIGQDNPIISGGAGQTSGVFILRPGSPLYSFYGWAIDGIWQEGDDFSVTRDA